LQHGLARATYLAICPLLCLEYLPFFSTLARVDGKRILFYACTLGYGEVHSWLLLGFCLPKFQPKNFDYRNPSKDFARAVISAKKFQPQKSLQGSMAIALSLVMPAHVGFAKYIYGLLPGLRL